MKQHHETRGLQVIATITLALLFLTACGDSGHSVRAESNQTASGEAVHAEPDPARVLERSAERWRLVVAAKDDQEVWVEVYRYLAPAVRAEYPLTSYIPAKANFDYDQPSKPKLLKLDGDHAYVAVNATWLAYTNPDVRAAEGGSNLVKPFQSIEEWHWVDGEWFLFQPHRASDFHRQNPGFFGQIAKDAEKGSGDE